jgi:hypothetical protein
MPYSTEIDLRVLFTRVRSLSTDSRAIRNAAANRLQNQRQEQERPYGIAGRDCFGSLPAKISIDFPMSAKSQRTGERMHAFAIA